MANKLPEVIHFERIGAQFMRRDPQLFSNERRFRAFFGVAPQVCAKLWSSCSVNLPSSTKPTHLLWALNFLKVYSTIEVLAAIAGVDEKTLRKWVWCIVEELSELKFVRY